MVKQALYAATFCLLAAPAFAGGGYLGGYGGSSNQSRGNYLSDYSGRGQSTGNYLNHYNPGGFGVSGRGRPSVSTQVVIHRKHANQPKKKSPEPTAYVVTYAPGQKLQSMGPSGNYVRRNFVPAAHGAVGIVGELPQK